MVKLNVLDGAVPAHQVWALYVPAYSPVSEIERDREFAVSGELLDQAVGSVPVP